MPWDIIIVGTGAVGSAALYQAAKRGAKVLGIDRFHPPHTLGSSHGDTRITRVALGEGARYVQFARRSHEIWRELEAEGSQEELLRACGCLIFGAGHGPRAAHGAADFLASTIQVAKEQGIPHEVLSGDELPARFPQFRWQGDELACYEPGGGFVRPERCIDAQIHAARRFGAVTRFGETLVRWEKAGSGVRVTTDRGTHDAGALILTTGAWMPRTAASLAGRARIYRQVLHWFHPDGPREVFTPERMPVYIRAHGSLSDMFYGFPAIDGPNGGMKLAGEQFSEESNPDRTRPEVSGAEIQAMHAAASPVVRISPRSVRAVVCKYTVTPDFHFVIDRLPGSECVWGASACSGHGFKHSAAVGEALAQAAIGETSGYDLSSFRA